MREQIIGGKNCYLYDNGEADFFLVQAVNAHELEVLDKEVEIIKALVPNVSFIYAAFLIRDWNKELAPWEAPAVFGKEGFGAGAADTLAFLTETLLPWLNHAYGGRDDIAFYLGGYSLAGLFALWAAYQTEAFTGIAAVSPSVWFPGWDTYLSSHSLRTLQVYLSLGDKEEKTRNKVMAKVGENIRKQDAIIEKENDKIAHVLEWNRGNHFAEPELRTAKGFAWLLNNRSI